MNNISYIPYVQLLIFLLQHKPIALLIVLDIILFVLLLLLLFPASNNPPIPEPPEMLLLLLCYPNFWIYSFFPGDASDDLDGLLDNAS